VGVGVEVEVEERGGVPGVDSSPCFLKCVFVCLNVGFWVWAWGCRWRCVGVCWVWVQAPVLSSAFVCARLCVGVGFKVEGCVWRGGGI